MTDRHERLGRLGGALMAGLIVCLVVPGLASAEVLALTCRVGRVPLAYNLAIDTSSQTARFWFGQQTSTPHPAKITAAEVTWQTQETDDGDYTVDYRFDRSSGSLVQRGQGVTNTFHCQSASKAP